MNRNANDKWLGGVLGGLARSFARYWWFDLWYKPWRCNLDLFNFLDDFIQAVDN